MAKIINMNDLCTIYMGITQNIIRNIEFASRICYDTNDKTTKDSWSSYIRARVNSGHESVTEHGLISTIIDFTATSVVTDFATASSLTDWTTEEVHVIEEALSCSNSLLHYVKEYPNRLDAMGKPILIISGNVKMWRDLFKYLFSNTLKQYRNGHGAVFSEIIKMFNLFNSYCDNIFTVDIPEMKLSQDFIQSSGYFSSNVKYRLVTKWKSVDIPQYDELDVLYSENGNEMRLLSLDNFAQEFNTQMETPWYIKEFINQHAKDLYSVSYVVNMPRVITQQEARHRINSISQRSQRYVDEVEKDADFYVPKEINGDKYHDISVDAVENIHESYTMHMTYNEFMQLSLKFYKALREDNIKKEDARFVLPNAIFSKMVVTKPFYTLPHYFKERCSDAAQKEIREPARALRDYLNNRFSYIVQEGDKLF